MERSGWFDDDDDDSPSEPLPSERVWRHPSELGPHGAFEAAVPRRRTGARFVTALTLGTAGSLVLAVLASVHAFGPTGSSGTATGNGLQSSLVGEGSSLGFESSTTRLLTVLTTAAPTSSTSVAASMPPMVKVRTGDADHTIAAALVDDGSLVTTVDDMGDATEGEAVLASGQTVKVVVERVDAETGVVHLRPATPVQDDDVEPATAEDTVWIGVSCGDGREPTPTTVPATTTTTESATTAPVTADEPTTTVEASEPGSSAPTSAATSRPAATASPTTAAPSTTAAPAAPTTTVGTLGVTTTTESAGAPGTTTTTAPATVSGARVLAVFPGSPADGQLLAGDLIVSVNGRAVHSTWALVLAVRQFPLGTEIKVGLLRDGAALTRTVVLAAAPTR